MQPPPVTRVAPGVRDFLAVEALLRAALAGGPPLVPAPADSEAITNVLTQASAALVGRTDLGDVAAVLSTSGSTGAPRGVALTRTNMRAAADAQHELLGGKGHWIAALPVTGVGGLMCPARAILAETQLFIDPDVAGAGSFGTTIGATVRAARAAIGPDRLYLSIVPTQLRRVLRSDPSVLAIVDAVLIGSAAANPADIAAARATGARIVESYGMTETCGGCVYDGMPLAGLHVSTDTPDATATGKLIVDGPTVAATYLPQPHVDLAAPVFRTSDVGSIDSDGIVTVLGRSDDVIISGGVNVSPRAVEAIVRSLDPGAEVVAIGIADADWGRSLVLFIDLVSELKESAIESAIRDALGGAAVPKQVIQTAIPMLGNGKPDVRALRSRVEN